MPTPRTTKFVAFDFTEEEMQQATRFSPLQLMLLQTLAAEAAEERLRLMLDLSKAKDEAVATFIQQEAALKGQQEAYENLILLAQETKHG